MYGVASVIFTAVFLPLLGFVAVCLRFYTRIRLTPTFVGIDDWLIVFSCLLVLGQGAAQIVGAVIGVLGRDNEPTADWRAANQAKIIYATLIFEKVTYTTIKLSVLFFYRRIFYRHRSFKIVNDVFVVLTAIWGLVFLLLQVILERNAHRTVQPWASQEWQVLWFAITDVLSDVAILTLPYSCIRKLQMSRRTKIELTFVFLLGTLSLVFGAIRLYFVSYRFAIFVDHSTSTSNTNTPPTIWTTAEVSIGLLAACLPPLKPLLVKIGGHVKHSFVPLRVRRSSQPDRLTRDENIARIDGFKEMNMETASKEADYEMSGYDGVQMVEEHECS